MRGIKAHACAQLDALQRESRLIRLASDLLEADSPLSLCQKGLPCRLIIEGEHGLQAMLTLSTACIRSAVEVDLRHNMGMGLLPCRIGI